MEYWSDGETAPSLPRSTALPIHPLIQQSIHPPPTLPPPIHHLLLHSLLTLAASSALAVEPLRHAADIRALTSEQAAKKQPVLLRGIVTLVHSREMLGMVVEESGTGIYVRGLPAARLSVAPESNLSQIEPGAEIEISGVTDAGGYAPVILPIEARLLGRSELPPPRPADLGSILTGRMDCQRIELTGIVQDVEQRGDRFSHLWFKLAVPGHLFTMMTIDDEPHTADHLIGASVRVRGVCLPFFNDRGELLGLRIQAQNLSHLTTLVPASQDPFAVPEITLRNLRPFSAEGPVLTRQRLKGIVTCARPGHDLYVQEGGRAVRINTRDANEFTPGDYIEASGFVRLGGQRAELHGAVLRKLGHQPPPAAKEIHLADVLRMDLREKNAVQPDYHGRLVRLAGRLLRHETTSEGPRLLISSQGGVFTAQLTQHAHAPAFTPPTIDSEVSITGICEVELASEWPASDFPKIASVHLLMRQSDDLVILRAASWWTSARLVMALGGTLAVLLLASAWVALLRRQVTRRTTQLAQEILTRHEAEVEFHATLRERERIAADLHDNTEQALTGLSLQLETAEALHQSEPARAASHLALARQILSSSREELRRSVWNLRATSLEGRTLAEALQDLATASTRGQQTLITVEITGTARPLADSIAGNLLSLAQETITNALKHARAAHTRLQLHWQPDALTLHITDDGCGFDPRQAPGPAQGHFGLQGMKERAKRLGGTLEVRSQPAQGTTILIRIPSAALVSPNSA